ncbi:MAG: MotA/TolQ/ExbB proton channel family protein [Acidobacteriota bacterium]
MIDSLTHLLLLISNALLLPVVVALLALFVWTVVLIGGAVKEWSERGRVRRAIDAAITAVQSGPRSEVWSALSSSPGGLPARLVKAAGDGQSTAAQLDRALTSVDHDVADAIAHQVLITRVSPMLGLMGTLIPLGPALSGLAAGNMAALSGNLIVAFTATVVGLLTSGLSYGISLARRSWYARDLSDLEFIVAQLKESR